jgi:hypothetical protein
MDKIFDERVKLEEQDDKMKDILVDRKRMGLHKREIVTRIPRRLQCLINKGGYTINKQDCNDL